jgi:hypothetical protein
MVKAADIGKGSRDFVSKDFFSGNEVKVNQGGCGKNTTTFKIGESVKADHKLDLAKCGLGSPMGPVSHKLSSNMDYESEGKYKTANANVTIKLNTNLAQCMDLNSYSVKKTVECTKDIAGIETVFDMTTAMKGVTLKPVDFGLAFALKQGYQFGCTGTIPNVASPAVSNAKFRIGFAGCSHMNVSAVTTTGKDWVFDGKVCHNGRTYAYDFNANTFAANIATNIPNGKMKISSAGVLTSFQKYPVSEVCAARFGCSLDVHSGKMSGLGMGLDFSL